MFEWESHGRIFENSHQKYEANTQYADADDEIDVVYICSMQKVKVKLEEGCGDFKTFQMLKWRGNFTMLPSENMNYVWEILSYLKCTTKFMNLFLFRIEEDESSP